MFCPSGSIYSTSHLVAGSVVHSIVALSHPRFTVRILTETLSVVCADALFCNAGVNKTIASSNENGPKRETLVNRHIDFIIH